MTRNHERPNILVILTDQQSANMMSCTGNPWLKTPAMDRLARTGIRFDRAYCSNPVCVPSRFSLMTGRMPSEIGLRDNDATCVDEVPNEIKSTGLGWLARKAGYIPAYAGKQHLPRIDAKDLGFDYFECDERDRLADACAEFIRQGHDSPFLPVASFINPHDICYMAIRDSLSDDHERRLVASGKIEIETLDKALRWPEGVSEEVFFAEYCPPLPPNFEPQENEPEAIRDLLAMRPFKKKARDEWPEERWRLHRWAYCRLTEMVDAQIARVLDALHDSGLEQNTVVIFTSDHGDNDASHRMEHKTALYEQPSRVPLIVSQPGATPPGRVDSTHLVSNGLDLVPTACDYMGVECPQELKGISFRALAEGRDVPSWRGFLPVESQIGRMIVAQRFKYILYDYGANCEQLMDLQNDPWETRNTLGDPGTGDALDELRAAFRSAFPSVNIPG